MELKMCPGCRTVFLGDRDRNFCPICVITIKSQEIASGRPADEARQERPRMALAASD